MTDAAVVETNEESTRARVVRAARAAFASQGYSGASMRKIAGDAGLTAMALYTYAPSKSALFQLVWEDTLRLIYAEYGEVVAGKTTLLEEVNAVLDVGGEILERNPDLLHFTIRIAADRDHEELRGLELTTSVTTEFFEQMVSRAINRGEIEATAGPRLVGFVTMQLWGLTTLAALDPALVPSAVRTAKWAVEGRLGRA